MDLKNNYRYFHRSFKTLYTGIPLTVIGAAVVFGKFFRRYVHVENVFTAMMVAGVLLILFFLVSFPRDGEFDRGISVKIRDIRAAAEEKITALEHTPHFMENYLAEGFVYGEGTHELKRGMDGVFRTDVYCATQFIITLKRLYIYSMRFSMLTDETEITFEHVDFDDLVSAQVKEELFPLTYNGEQGAIKRAFFTVTSKEKEYAFPSHNDALADGMASKIMLRNE